MARQVDRSFARLIAFKRIVTGSMSLAAAAALLVAVALHGSAPAGLVIAALVIFVGGGSWALRDGLRLRRELRNSGP